MSSPPDPCSLELAYAAASYALLWALSWWAVVGRGWGEAESAHDPASRWLYVRRLLLVGSALVGVSLAGGPARAPWGGGSRSGCHSAW